MKKVVILLVVVLLMAVVSSCTKEYNVDLDEAARTLFTTVCSADEALSASKQSNVVVIEGSKCTSGNDVWDTFFRQVSKGDRASVLCANYYVLDKDRVSSELYEAEKDKYPQLFFCKLEYDGQIFKVTSRQSCEEMPDKTAQFKFLSHFTGNAPEQSNYSTYDYYVLVNDQSLTWDDIMAGMISSKLGARVEHYTVIQTYLSKKEEG